MWLVGKTILKPGSKKGCTDIIHIAETLEDAQVKYREFKNERETYSAWLCPVFESTDHELPDELSHLTDQIDLLLSGTKPRFKLKEGCGKRGWAVSIIVDNGFVVNVEMINAESIQVDAKTIDQHKRSLPAFSREFNEQGLMEEGYKRSAHAYEIEYKFAKAAA